MTTLLIAIDGSDASARAVQAVITLYRRIVPIEIRLIHVQAIDDTVPDEALAEPAKRAGARGAGERALQRSQSLLEQAGFACTSEVRSGYVPSVIVDCAKAMRCDAIVMGTRGMGSTPDLIGSIARQVIGLAEMPVTLVK